MSSVDVRAIVAICSNFYGSDYYWGEAIPKKQLANFRKARKIPDTEHIIAFVNAAVFKSGKKGLAIGTSGVYWKNSWTIASRKKYLSWEEFAGVSIQKLNKTTVQLGRGNFFDMSGSTFNIDTLIRLLQNIQALLYMSTLPQQFAVQNPPLFPSMNGTQTVVTQTITTHTFEMPADSWLIAVEGQQYGPYDMNQLGELLGSGQISPETTYVWKPGMTSWVPFTQQPELGELLNRNTVATQAPPPSPSSEPHSAVDSGETVSQDTNSDIERYVDINTASYEELVEILGVGAVGAKRIMQEREAIGGFQTPEQVGELLGLKPHQVEKIRKLARFTPLPNKQNTGRIVDY